MRWRRSSSVRRGCWRLDPAYFTSPVVVSVALTKRLEQAHDSADQRFVSAQVLGRPDVVAIGKLSVIAAG